MNEIETRIIDIDVANIIEKLLNIGAIKVKQEEQINNIFDFPNRLLLKEKGYARIRIVNDQLKNENFYYMTTKKLLSQEKYKVMDENEVEINDPIEGENIFKSLGLKLFESIKKYRESYKYKNTLIEIDINEKSFCPFPYIEIETSIEAELKEVVTLLGYTMEDTTSKTIYQIIEERKNN
ncbi:CYTH domain-containing protein [Clostridium botulinum]|uniref:Adenylate cyclase n=1 Tax=Clostridium botulinum C/D str. DC5 TaxID=1443128 RepID=A0A0A0IBL7_CLOBO|nr:CYTH domain-containing protein [Clostridium botulinum]KEI06654.1 adenylate cyclase [Clostridium botulinum C/D str. BKT75002]KEI09566.1 adenylate cyclase [Clostridium botulinum C/D str. BKT2873]KGM93412.1 adenylate cyclase [Clostridium botulinum D str. CCUG 7971]KGM98854.1 adenylate cyclase [Clostridium botulinum C/D str. DC5]KOC46888.1 adenylate cyclase [Clostridium botulinum]